MENGFSRSREGTDSLEEQARSENRGESRHIFDMLKMENKRIVYIDKAINILKEEYKNISEEHENLLKRKYMLELVKEVIRFNKSSYKEIILSIHEKIEDIAEEGNIKQNVLFCLKMDMECAFSGQTGPTLRRVKYRRVNAKINIINEEIERKKLNIISLKSNEKYQEYKKIINSKIEKYKENMIKIEKRTNDTNEIQDMINLEKNDSILSKLVDKFIFPEMMKGFNELQDGVMKDYYKLSDAITRLGDEAGLMPSALNRDTHFNPNSKKVECLHADDPDWSAYEKQMKDLKGRFSSLENAKWHQDYQKNLKNKLETYGENLDKLRGMDLNNSSEIEKCMEDVASLEKKLDEDEQRYGFHPDVVQACAEYRKMIKDFRSYLGRRFWEDEV